MSILVDKDTKVIVQGITGKYGSLHARHMLEYGTRIVAGVAPGRGGLRFEDAVPVFDSVHEAAGATGADASIIFVAAPFAPDAIAEALDAGMGLVVVITEGIPTNDMVKIRADLDARGALMVGPNCPGVITPGGCKLGIMPAYIHEPGPIGLISRSGTLTYEAVFQLSQQGLGQSTCIGIGGDPVGGLDFVACLELFEKDPQTEGVVLIGEIGGSAEEEAASFIQEHMSKPVAAFISGATAPPGKRMGHAGAIISQGKGTAEEKIAALRKAGAAVAATPALIGETMKKAMG
jgi:succinyl-CoA synthetase alpha subunit